MPLRLVRSADGEALWSTCADRFLDVAAGRSGPAAHRAWMWIVHRTQRDALYRLATERGVSGWLDPPVSFFSQLPGVFGIRERPVGILTGRLLVARLAAEHGRRLGIGGGGRRRGPARAHMLDSVFSELLPEGVTPEELEAALAALDGDEFARTRNAWVSSTYAAFLEELGALERYDPRSVHARIAGRIEAGELPRALGGAAELHVYGITSLRSRLRLFRALSEQGEVSVSVYLRLEEEPSEWEELLPVEEVEVLEGGDREPAVTVQPAPDALREARWVARRVKRLLVEEEVEPRRVAVVARTGREDTGRIHRALRAAGIPCTVRLRTPLNEVPALRAALLPFRAEKDGWDYRALREVATSPYFGLRVDPRILDFLAGRRRIEGLASWVEAMEGLADLVEGENGRRYRQEGVYGDRVAETREALAGLRERAAPLSDPRDEAGWIRLTLDLLGDRGWAEELGLRRRLCRAPADRQDIVRLDQRGVRTLEALLREWAELVESGKPLDVAEWHDRLRRLLEANEIALSTPLQTGVQVLEAHEAALTPYRHVFVVHANDGVFPRPPGRSGAFSEEERARLRETGLPLTSREEALRRERSLWRAVTRADRVTITYRSTDARGVPRLPSLMVPDHDPATELPRVLEEADADAASSEEHRRQEVLRLATLRRSGDRSPFPTPDPDRLAHAVLGACAEELRTREPAALRPHAWNGALRDPVVRATLAERFDDGYVWSASQLQTYGIRPFDFLLDRVLRLGDAEKAEEDTSPLEFGAVAHDILERFYGAYVDGGSGEIPAALEGEAEALLERVARAACEAAEEDAERWLGLPALWAVRREEIVERVREFLTHELPFIARRNERPIALELSFGASGEEAASPPLLLRGTDVWGREAALRFRGRIDRVDRCGGGNGGEPRLKILDYKSGGYPTRYDDGATLQTGLYMEAVELLGHGAPEAGAYRSIKKRTMDGGKLKREELAPVLAFALSIPRRVRAGLFEAVQAASAKLVPWQPGLEVTRTGARLPEGTRFDVPPEEAATRAAAIVSPESGGAAQADDPATRGRAGPGPVEGDAGVHSTTAEPPEAARDG